MNYIKLLTVASGTPTVPYDGPGRRAPCDQSVHFLPCSYDREAKERSLWAYPQTVRCISVLLHQLGWCRHCPGYLLDWQCYGCSSDGWGMTSIGFSSTSSWNTLANPESGTTQLHYAYQRKSPHRLHRPFLIRRRRILCHNLTMCSVFHFILVGKPQQNSLENLAFMWICLLGMFRVYKVFRRFRCPTSGLMLSESALERI